jgi:hypothetical protein
VTCLSQNECIGHHKMIENPTLSENGLPINLPMRSLSVAIVTLTGRTIGRAAHLFVLCARKIVKPLAKAI